MSDFRVMREVSLYLRSLLFEYLRANDALTHRFTSEGNISLDSPADLAEGVGAGMAPPLLSLYLHQVTSDPHLRNPGDPAASPLSLDLAYLFTPFSPSSEDNLAILGHAMQILAAHPVIRAGALEAHPREIQISVKPMTLEELTRIWRAFHQPYRLSVCYQAQSVRIGRLPRP